MGIHANSIQWGTAERPACLLSVVVPAYQAEGSIVRLLDSLCAWEGADIEIIVVNDGSSDGTRELVAARAAADSRVLLLDKENRGRSSARNRGVEEARGEWVMFADADDYLLPGWPDFVRAASGLACDLVIFGMLRSIDSMGARDAESFASRKPRRVEVSAAALRRSLIEGSCEALVPKSGLFEWNACWGRIYRNECVARVMRRANGKAFPEGLKFSEDRLFNLLYLDVASDSAVTFDYEALYYWDLGLSSTVGSVSVEDAASLYEYREALSNPVYAFADNDVHLLMATETAAHFRRTASLPPAEFKKASYVWREILDSGALCGCQPVLKQFAGKSGWVCLLAVSLLFAGHPYVALLCQRLSQSARARFCRT